MIPGFVSIQISRPRGRSTPVFKKQSGRSGQLTFSSRAAFSAFLALACVAFLCLLVHLLPLQFRVVPQRGVDRVGGFVHHMVHGHIGKARHMCPLVGPLVAEQPWRVGCRPSAHAAGLGELGAEHLIRFERASVLPQSARYLVKKQKLARKATRVGMSHGHSASCERGHQHMEQLAHNFSRSLGWQHGKFGIFANNYQRVKTRFMFLRVCELARQGRVRSMCELGFNAGLSALLLLEAAPGATLVSFDLLATALARQRRDLHGRAYRRLVSDKRQAVCSRRSRKNIDACCALARALASLSVRHANPTRCTCG